MKYFLLALTALFPLVCGSCAHKKPDTLTGQFAATFNADVSIGNYYKTKGMTSFYDKQPDSLIAKTPSRFLGPGHVVQLLDPNSGGGWARVRNEKFESGFIKFDKLKIVPIEKQPLAPKRKRKLDDY
jgi:hypothetical protein